MMKLGGYVQCTTIAHEFEFGGQRSISPGTKKRKSVAFFGSRPLGRGPRAALFRERSSGAWLRRVGKPAPAV